MGDIAASGVVVNCTEYANGQLSNVFILSDGIIITQSIVWPLSPSLLGTKEYEAKARDAFESRVAIEPALLEFREIISECRLDGSESNLYSSIWEIYTIRAQIRQLKRLARAWLHSLALRLLALLLVALLLKLVVKVLISRTHLHLLV